MAHDVDDKKEKNSSHQYTRVHARSTNHFMRNLLYTRTMRTKNCHEESQSTCE